MSRRIENVLVRGADGQAKHLLTAANEVDDEVVCLETSPNVGEKALRGCGAVRSNVEDSYVFFLLVEGSG